MHVNLVMGRLISKGLVDPGKAVSQYLPSIGSGYASATVQILLDMGVSNAFSEDYGDPDCDAYLYEVSLGWRLPAAGQPDLPLRHYVATISGDARPSCEVDYKSANTDVLAWIADEVTGGGLVGVLRAIADEAGYEGTFHISTDREGFPALSGGGCLSARDLARFGLLFVRESQAPHGAGSFIRHSLARAAPSFAKPRDWIRYSNHLFTNGRWIGHGGYGGQFLLVDMQTGTSCAFLSVLENDSGYDQDYMNRIIEALQEIACT
jgi:CubicO group peptidase (beta-lactamase class C family)